MIRILWTLLCLVTLSASVCLSHQFFGMSRLTLALMDLLEKALDKACAQQTELLKI